MPRSVFVCEACGQEAPQWTGRCGGCGAWGSVAQQRSSRAGSPLAPPTIAALLDEPGDDPAPTRLDGVDRVLGGGLVPGSVVLLAGAPGIGKSTLLLQVLERLGSAGSPCLLASGEESQAQVARRARRLGVDPATIRFTPGRDLAGVLAAARQERPAVLAVDSIQTLRDPEAPWTPGGVSQVRSATDALVGLAKSEGIAVVMSGHVTKDGDLAGPRALEHTVDVVLAFQGDPRSGLRVLAGTKNRFGAEGEQAWFEMTPTGLREIDPSSVLLSREAVPGSAVALPQVGRRAMAVDVQALVGSLEGPARRQVTGLDPRRFQLVAAVLDRVGGLRFARAELFGAVAGGARLDDPACDLAVAIALVSAATGTVPPSGVAFVGEVSLTGSVRPAPGMEARLRAAGAAGCDVVVASTSDDPPHAAGTPRIHRVRDLRQAVSWALPTSISTVRKLPA